MAAAISLDCHKFRQAKRKPSYGHQTYFSLRMRTRKNTAGLRDYNSITIIIIIITLTPSRAHAQRRVIVVGRSVCVCVCIYLFPRFLSNCGCCRYQTWICGYVQRALGTARVWSGVVQEQHVYGGGIKLYTVIMLGVH